MSEQVIATGLVFPEGPAFDRDGNLFFVELAAHRVSKMTPDGKVSVFAETEGSPNGLAFGPDGNMYVCNGGNRWAAEKSTGNEPGPGDRPGLIQRLTPGGEFSTLISEIDGTPINSPNDIVFDPEGNFYFTDPVWPKPGEDLQPGTLCYSDLKGNARRVHTGVMYPNGLGVTDDGGTLIVCETFTGKLLAFPIVEPGKLGDPRDYGFLGERTIPDGLCQDEDGRVICAGHGTWKLHVFPAGGGPKEEEIELTDRGITNVCFGGPDFKTLYITQADQGRIATYEWKTRGMKLFPDRVAKTA